jgi:hypothetical protein
VAVEKKEEEEEVVEEEIQEGISLPHRQAVIQGRDSTIY